MRSKLNAVLHRSRASLRWLSLGMIVLGLQTGSAWAQAPSNDNFANAWLLAGDQGATNGYNIGATLETGEPLHYASGNSATVWFRWSPSIMGIATFDTLGSSFDTVLAVYGSSTDPATFGSLIQIARNDDWWYDLTSELSFYAYPSNNYYVVVQGFQYSSGTTSEGFYYLNWNLSAYGTNVVGPIPLSTNQVQFASDNFTVSEDTPGFATVEVWYNGGSTIPVLVDYVTSDGTAMAGIDYLPTAGTLMFEVGQTNQTFVVQIIDNAMANDNKTINLALSNPTGGGVTMGPQNTSVLTIQDNETVPFKSTAGEFNFTASLYRVTENESIHTSLSPVNDRPYTIDNDREVLGAMLTVNRLNGHTGRVLVDWYTTNKFSLTNSFFDPLYPYYWYGYYFGTNWAGAVENFDYTATNGTLVFDDFQTSTNFVIPVDYSFYGSIYSLTNAPVLYFNVVLANPRSDTNENPQVIIPTLGATNSALVGIAQVNNYSAMAFERLTYRMNEYGRPYQWDGNTNHNRVRVDILYPPGGQACIHVWVGRLELGYPLMAGSDYADNESYQTANPVFTDGTAPIVNLVDFTAADFNLSFAPNQTAAFFYVECSNDDVVEFNEDIYMEIGSVPGCGTTVHPWAEFANLTILFDDQPAAAVDRDWNPPNDPRTYPPYNPRPGANGEVLTVVVQPDERQIIGGAFTGYNTMARNRVARINQDGSNDASFDIGTGANDYIAALALYPGNNLTNAGKIIIAGNFTSFNSREAFRIARLNPDGTLDATFRPGDGANAPIRSVSLQNDGKIVVVGEFTQFNGEARNRIARLNEDGSVDLSFEPGFGADDTVWSVDVRDTPKNIFVPRSATGTEYEDVNIIDTGANQGTITVDYDFYSIPDTIRVFYQGARLLNLFTNGAGRLTIPYGPGTNSEVTIIMNQGIGIQGTLWEYKINITPVVRERTVFVAGDFTTINGQPRYGIARLRDNGTLDDTFDPRAGADNTVYAVAVQADGKVLIGGAFTDIDFRSRNGIARLLSDGSLDTAYDPGTGFNDTVMSISLQYDGKALVGGYFTSYNQTRRVGLARLFQHGLLDTSFMDTAYNQFAGVIQNYSFSPQNSVKSIFPYTITNIEYITQITVTSNGGTVVTNTAQVPVERLSEYVMIGGTFTQLGGNRSYSINDTNRSQVWTRQDKTERMNIARLIGGYTPGPGNLTFRFTERIDEYSTPLTIEMQRRDGRLGTLQAVSLTGDRVARGGIDYSNVVVTNIFEEYAYAAPRSVGWVDPIYFYIPIIDNLSVDSDRIFDLLMVNPVGSITLGGEQIPLGGARGRPDNYMTIVDDDSHRGIIAFSAPAYTVNEKDIEAVITLIRTNGSTGTVSVDLSTGSESDTAHPGPNLPGYDYQSMSQKLVFADGQTTNQVRIKIWNDTQVESDERITLVLTNATGGAFLPGGLATSTELSALTIIDDDFLSGRLNFSSATYQTNENAGFARITVTRSGGNLGAVTVFIAATNGTAASGQDFYAVTNVLSWDAGISGPKTFNVPLLPDLLVEGPETVNLRLFNASTNGAIGSRGTAVLTLIDDNAYGTFDFSQPAYDANENGGAAIITVVRSQGTNGMATVDYEVLDGSARNGLDYVASNGTLQFLPGEISKSFSIGLNNDTLAEGIETVMLNLVNRSNATLGPISTATLNIIDDESVSIPAGSLDSEFDAAVGANQAIYALAQQLDGNLLIGGDFTTFNHISRARLARLLPNGALDSSFNAGLGPNRTVRALAVQDNGKVLVAGLFTSINATNRNHVARLHQDGSLDGSFDPGAGADNPIYAMALLRDGRVALGGSFTRFNGFARPGIVVLNTNGSVSASFDPNPGVDGPVYAIAVQPDGCLVIGGDFTTVQNVSRPRIARLYPNGTLDQTFDPGLGADATVRALAVQRDGKVVAGGSFVSMGGVERNFLARLNSNGSLDDSYLAAESGGDNPVYALALQADGKLVVAGDFNIFNGVTRHRITRLESDGATDPTINFGAGANDFIAALLIQPDRKIVLAGGFTQMNGQAKQRIARVHGGAIAGSGALEFAAPQYYVDESSPYAVVTVLRRGGLFGQVAVDARTYDITAAAGVDYSNRVETLIFPEGEVEQTFLVPIYDDQEIEEPEYVYLTLENFIGAAVGPQPFAQLVIDSDDSLVSFQTANFYVNENAAGGYATITVVRTGATNSLVSVDYYTQDGTATNSLDYLSASGSLLFNPGQMIKQFFVTVTNDTMIEGNETVKLVLTNTSVNGLLGTYPAATLNIIDDELAAGVLNFSSPVYTVNEYETNIIITVTRSGGSGGFVSVNYYTSDGIAQAGLDYRPMSGSISFADGETNKTFSVPILQDYLDETNETVILTLANATGGAVLGGTSTSTLTIQNTRLINGNLNFAATNYTVNESNLVARVTVTRSYGSNGPITVNYRTIDGTALAGSDYIPVTNTLAWASGDASAKTFSVTLVNDTVVEEKEFFNALLFSPAGGATLGGRTNTTVTVLDDDTGPGLLSFNAAAYYVEENLTNAYITVIRTFGSAGINSIQFRTRADGTASAYRDFIPTNGTLTFLNGETSKVFAVRLLEKTTVEENKTIPLELYSPLYPASTNGQIVTALLTVVESQAQAGSTDVGYNIQANDQVYALVLQTNLGKIYAGGDFTTLNGVPRLRVGRINPNGSLDTMFDASTNFNSSVRAIALQNPTNLLVGGVFTNVGGTGKSYLARVRTDGSLDTNLLANVDNFVHALAAQSDGKIVVGGAFTKVNGEPRNFLARLNADGSLDANFKTNAGVDAVVRAILVQTDGRIIIGGDFALVNGVPRRHVARLMPDGEVDFTFDPGVGPNDTVQSLALQSDGKVLLGGRFTTVNGTTMGRVARLTDLGALDDAFQPGAGANEWVAVVALEPGGKIYVAGGFTEIDGIALNRLARLNSDGSVDTSINFGAGANDFINTLVVQPDRKLVIGGGFTAFDGVARQHLARINGGENVGMGSFVFSVTNFTVIENEPKATITVRRTLGTGGFVTVDYTTVDGTAQAGIHYGPVQGTLIFGPGETLKTFEIPIVDDTATNVDRTVGLVLSNPFGATLGLNSTATLTIIDNDSVVEFDVNAFSVSENAGNAVISVQRRGGSVGTVTVDYFSRNGTATNGVDYGAVADTLIFTNGQTLATFTVPIFDDGNPEPNETVLLWLTNATGTATLGLDNSILTIVDDDFSPGMLSFAQPIYYVNEQTNYATILVQRAAGSSGSASVQYSTSDDTARAGVNYLPVSGQLAFADTEMYKTFTVPIINNEVVSVPLMLNLTLSNPVGGALGISAATLVIEPDNAILDFELANFIVTEDSTNAVISVTRNGGGTNIVSVEYVTRNGTATNGVNFTNVTGRLTFGPADTNLTFLVPLINDNVGVDNLYFFVALTNELGEAVLGTNSIAQVTILDDDASFVFEPVNYIINEAVGNVLVTVTRKGRTNGLASVDFATGDGTATAGADYVFVSRTLTFADGQLSQTVSIPIVNDAVAEGNELLYLYLNNPSSGSTLGATSTGTVTIVDNEDALRFELAESFVDEGATNITLYIIRMGVPSGPISVAYATSNLTATAGVNYSNVSGALIFSSFEFIKAITIPIIDNTEAEGDKTFAVRLYNISGGASIITPGTNIVTVVDNDVSFRFGASTYSVMEDATNALISVLRLGGTSNLASVTLVTSNGTARAGFDFVALSNQLVFPAGVATQLVALPILDDLLIEGNETAFLRLLNPAPTNVAVLSSPSEAALTILDNDSCIIVPSGVFIESESGAAGLKNNRIDPGETIGAWFGLRNLGNVDALNLKATLLETNGIMPIWPVSQTYPPVLGGGITRSMRFSFTANGAIGAQVVATFQLQDGTNNLGLVSFPFILGETAAQVTNSTSITIKDNNPAAPYPSTINISGISGMVNRVTVTLRNMSHMYPGDVDVLLVGPTGERALIMSDTASNNALSGITITLDDQAVKVLPQSAAITSGSYRPANYTDSAVPDSFPAPAPAGPFQSALSVFNGKDPNGTWSLYVVDDTQYDAGNIAGGWSLSISTFDPNVPSCDLGLTMNVQPATALPNHILTYYLSVTNGGPNKATNVVITNILPDRVTYLGCVSGHAAVVTNKTVTVNLGNINDIGGGTTVALQVRTAADLAPKDILFNTATVSTPTMELNLDNNTASAKIRIIAQPLLAMTRKDGALVITWPEPAYPCYLEACDDLAAGNWARVTNSQAVVSGGQVTLIINPPNAPRKFYRLREGN